MIRWDRPSAGFAGVDAFVLDVTDGGGLIRDWQEAIVPAPKIAGGKISGPGWTLDLAEGWILVPGTRQGDYTISH